MTLLYRILERLQAFLLNSVELSQSLATEGVAILFDKGLALFPSANEQSFRKIDIEHKIDGVCFLVFHFFHAPIIPPSRHIASAF